MSAASVPIHSVDSFLRAEPANYQDWIVRRQSRIAWFCVVAVVVGAGAYGIVIGSWRDAVQALYTGIKLPLAILLTTLGNGLLNGMLAPLLGLNISFRQSLIVVLISFAITSLILGALSPVALFIIWNTPPLSAMTRALSPEYGFLQLMLAAFVALAGNGKYAINAAPATLEWKRYRRAPRSFCVVGVQSVPWKPDLLDAAPLHLGSGAAG